MPDLEVPADILAEFEASLDADIASWTEDLIAEFKKRGADDSVEKFDPDQPRDEHGRWSGGAEEVDSRIDDPDTYRGEDDWAFGKLIQQRGNIPTKSAGAFAYYRNNGYAEINAYLRSGDSGDEFTDGLVKDMQAVVGTNKLGRDVTLYRGALLGKGVADKLKPGTTFQDKAFLSTTVSAHVAFDAASGQTSLGGMHKSDVGVIFRILGDKNTRGAAMLKSPEREVLLSPGTKFRVRSVEPLKSKWRRAYKVVTVTLLGR